jgi:hypothetical protein
VLEKTLRRQNKKLDVNHFKARHGSNIKKGKMSAAYWANRTKWGLVLPILFLI